MSLSLSVATLAGGTAAVVTSLITTILSGRAEEFTALSNRAHAQSHENEDAQLARTWTRSDNVDAWRHRRMYASLDPLLAAFPRSRWVTVGDGRYANDAHYLAQQGAGVIATDISETLLARAKAEGFVSEYRVENAEALSFPDASFDFALCKESFHHFPRPMLALYEMLRVARRGVVLIEPNQTPTLKPPRVVLKMLAKELLIRVGLGRFFPDRSTEIIDFGADWYEEVGNYGYCITRRDIERVALALDYPAVAFRGINDTYVEGVEYEAATTDSPLFQRIQADIETQDRRCRQRRGLNMSRTGLLVAAIFKEPVEASLGAALGSAGYEVRQLRRNPYRSRLQVQSETTHPGA